MTAGIAWNTSTPRDRADILRKAVGFSPKGGSEFYHVRFHRLSERLQLAISDWLTSGIEKRLRLTRKDLAAA